MDSTPGWGDTPTETSGSRIAAPDTSTIGGQWAERVCNHSRSAMRVAVGREVRPGERRVALTPETATTLIASGAAVRVESGAGAPALATDDDYRSAGAEVQGASAGDVYADADVVLHVRPLLPAEIARLPRG